MNANANANVDGVDLVAYMMSSYVNWTWSWSWTRYHDGDSDTKMNLE